MATVRAACPACGNSLKFPSSWAGKAMKCTKCNAVIQASVTAAAKPVPESVTTVPVVKPEAVYVPESVHLDDVPTIAPAGMVSALPEPEMVSQATRRYKAAKPGIERWIALAVVLAIGTVGGVLGSKYYFDSQKTSTVDPTVSNTTKTNTTLTATAGANFPRRLLAINVTKYAYLNPLSGGVGGQGDAVTTAVKKIAFEWRIPQDGPTSQTYLLTDSASDKATPIVKAVLQPTLERFIETSRKQDRIVIYLGGHAIEKEGKAYFAGADGDADDVTSLIPINAIYERLKGCPAQQKIVIWDVCRFNPAVGRSMPGSEPMTPELHKVLTSPPPGVQAWVTCSPNENAIELTKSGSEFLSAFRIVGERGLGPKISQTPNDAIPISDWLTATQTKLGQNVTKDGKPAQTMMLAGAITGEAVAVNAEEPLAPRFDIPPPPQGADPVLVADAFALIDLPSIRSDKNASAAAGRSLFVAADALKDYLVDPMTVDEALKQKEKFPIRAATAKAILTIRSIWKSAEGNESGGGLRETFVGEANDSVKRSILKEQEVPARIILELEGIITEFDKLEKDLAKEPSKRWRATFQFIHAQAKARWAFMNEYNLMLGVIQKNELPPIDAGKGETGWAMIGTDTMKSKKDVKEQLESSVELFEKIATEHKGTPWAVLAKQAKNAKLGLEWRAVGPDAKRD